MNITQLNERVAIVEFHAEISEQTVDAVQKLKTSIEATPLHGQQEVWSSYHNVAIAFDPTQTTFQRVKQGLMNLKGKENGLKQKASKIQIPIRYHKDTKDILTLSESLKLSPGEIAKLHQTPIYQVAMLGFQPGFPFLMGLPKQLHHPRKDSPSLSVPKGSVAIGGAQTGIYPSSSPGGWYVIGHTPLEMFSKPDQFLLKPGDLVEFILS